MKTIRFTVIAILAVACLTGCSNEIPEGSTADFDNLLSSKERDELMVKKNFLPLQHPCMLHTSADIARVRQNLANSPWKEAYEHLAASPYAQVGQRDRTSALKDGYLKRMDAGNWSSKYSDYSNYTALMYDAAACYQLALRYQLSGDTQYADNAVSILNAWKNNCKGVLRLEGYTNNIPDPNIYLIMIQGHQMANAAELLRNYEGWAADDFNGFKEFMKTTFYEVSIQFLKNHQGNQGSMHAWLNWDLATLTSVLSVGILCDDNNMINWAISYFKNEDGLFDETGNIMNAVPYVHQDPDSPEQLGQCEESGRDQGHATLCVSLMGVFCQMALNVGEDLFAYADYRALKMAEYVGKYNLIKDDCWNHSTNVSSNTLTADDFVVLRTAMPYTAYTNPSWSCPEISASTDTSRGSKRPCWELFYGYAKSHGQSAIYCQKWSEQMRAYNDYKSDGGGGDYGPNSGGYDQLGYGTLMFAR